MKFHQFFLGILLDIFLKRDLKFILSNQVPHIHSFFMHCLYAQMK